MALGTRKRGGNGLDAWPGYVDALSTLLMVIIFVLMVFVLAQGFLGAALSSRDQALDQLNRQVAELSQLLNVERGQNAELRAGLTSLTAERDRLAGELRLSIEASSRLATERDTLRGERDRAASRLVELELAARGAAERITGLEGGLAAATARADQASQEAARVARDLAEARRELAAMRAEIERLNQTVRVDRATIEARIADLAQLAEQIRALQALRERLEGELRSQGEATANAARLGDAARAQVALLQQEIEALRAQLARISAALELAESQGRDKDAQLVNLGQRLNAALAAQVENLQRYRSDFFGRLREVLGNRPEIRVVGDRFVFQSEVLFPPGSADLTGPGEAQIRQLGGVLRDIARRIPPEVNWVLRIDGHADRTPISNQRFASNWELSAARAIAVARLLVQEGLSPARVAPTAFGDNQPIDPGGGSEAFARNRRIEFRLTDR
jgi:chemotaxis protein MotB